MTPKPIFIVELPSETNFDTFSKVSKDCISKMADYHVLFYIGKTDEIKFQCFFEKDFNEVKFESIKELIESSLKKT